MCVGQARALILQLSVHCVAYRTRPSHYLSPFPNSAPHNDAGDIFIADYESCRIRKIDRKTQIITTIAGTGECVSGGDGGPAIAATLNYPSALVADKSGNLFFVEGATARVRRIDRLGVITTYAGTGEKGFSGDGGAATEARLNNPSGLAVDEAGNLYIADYVNNRIRRVDAQTHTITTVAGNGKPVRVDVIM
jgi:sugar lactone lactonase YvrE